MEVSFNTGSFIGPLISGGLTELLNYYYVNCIMGMYYCILCGEVHR